MKIAIVSTPYLEPEVMDESRMLKAALLYGDRVTLLRVNIGYAIISLLREGGLQKLLPSDSPLLKKFMRKYRNIYVGAGQIVQEVMGSHDLDKFIDLLIADEHTPAEWRRDLEFYRATPGNTKDTAVLARRNQVYDRVRDLYWQALRKNMDDCYANALHIQNQLLNPAIQNDLLEVKDYTILGDGHADRSSDLGTDLLHALQRVDTLPMLSALFSRALTDTNNLLEEAERPLRPSALVRTKELLLAEGLFDRLPLFENASLDQILEIRSDLQPYLIPFRGAVIGFSEQIKEAPWSDEFAFEVDRVFRREVEPAILAIEAEVKARKYLSEFVTNLISKPLVVPSGSLLGLALTQLSSLPDIVTQPLAVGGAVALVGYDAYREWKQKLATSQQNQLYFLYRAGNLLGQRGN